MSMSKNNYVAIAATIKNIRELCQAKEAREAITYIASDLAREFVKDNPRFDSDKFLRACGLEF